MRTAVLGTLALSSLLVTGAARAQSLGDAPAGTVFGGAGQVAVSTDFSLAFVHENETSTLLLAPAVDYFFLPQLSLGGQVLFSYSSSGDVSRTMVGIGPRVGYNIPLTPMFSLYPRAGFAFTHVTDSAQAGPVDVSRSANYLGLFLYAPFLFHPVPHFFIGLGPSLSGNVAGGDSSARHLRFAIESTVGGYFDW
jgi:hypothetical protein